LTVFSLFGHHTFLCIPEGVYTVKNELDVYLLGIEYGDAQEVHESLGRIRSMTEALLERVSFDDEPMMDVRLWKEL
jgi:hypothetical protein